MGSDKDGIKTDEMFKLVLTVDLYMQVTDKRWNR